jgi:hypothetical protein
MNVKFVEHSFLEEINVKRSGPKLMASSLIPSAILQSDSKHYYNRYLITLGTKSHIPKHPQFVQNPPYYSAVKLLWPLFDKTAKHCKCLSLDPERQ